MIAAALSTVCGLGTGCVVWSILSRRPEREDSRASAVPGRLRRRLDDAGLSRLTVTMYLVSVLTCSLLFAALVGAVSGVPAMSVVGLTVGVVAGIAWVHGRTRRRLISQREHWPDLLDHLVADLRSGHTMAQALGRAASRAPAAIREPFETLQRDWATGADVRFALTRAKDRLADPIADRLFETLRITHEVGGTETVRILHELSEQIRENETIRREAHSRQSWVRNAAILGAVAPWIVLVLLSTRPETALAYRSFAGSMVIVIGVAVTVVAYTLMLALGRLRDEQRWLR